MEWQQVIGFVQVAKLKSFTKAGEATFRTQSAVSQQMQALEAELGCQLVERRGNRNIQLTLAGERFLEFCQTLVLQKQYLEQDLMSIQGLRRGRLKVAGPFTTLYHLLPEIFQRFLQKFPYVDLVVMDQNQGEAIRRCQEGEVDLVFILESRLPAEFNKFRWKKVDPILLVHKTHPLSNYEKVEFSQVIKYPLIIPTHGANRDLLNEKLRQAGAPYRIAMESSNVELSSLYVEMGFGVAFATMIKDRSRFESRNLKYLLLTDWGDEDYLVAAWSGKGKRSAAHKDFLDILKTG